MLIKKSIDFKPIFIILESKLEAEVFTEIGNRCNIIAERLCEDKSITMSQGDVTNLLRKLFYELKEEEQ